MAQIFHPSTNTLSRVSIFGAAFAFAALLGAGGLIIQSPYVNGVGVAPAQPVQFSHRHHVNDDGIDCRYCHTTAQVSPFAGMPPTETCMHCHSQLFNNSPIIQPILNSYKNGTPLRWTRVYQVPDFVYFDHSAHVNKGIGCETCHGRVDQMPLIQKASSLQMTWCLDCHRHPEQYVRPASEVFSMTWQPPPDQLEQGRQLVQEYGIRSLVNCSTCHR